MRLTVPKRRALIALLLLGATAAHAQSEVATNPPPAEAGSSKKAIGEYWAVRLRYGLAYRMGGQSDLGPGLVYSGITFNDLQLDGWAWFGYLGAKLQFQREAFGLFNPMMAAPVTSGGLIRAGVQIAGRVALGPLRPELYAGYAFQQLPTFGPSGAPVFAAATRHAANFGVRLLFDLGPIAIEARGELPLALATAVPGMNVASGISQGFSAGGALRVQMFNAGNLHVGALLDGQYVKDIVVGKDAMKNDLVVAPQGVVRVGVALDLQWRELLLTPKFGGVVVKVSDLDTKAPLAGADVTIAVGGQERPLAPDASGALSLRGLPPGAFTLRASAEGYLPFESAGSITAGVDTPVEVPLKKAPPKVGGLSIVVAELDTKKPLPGVTVTIGDQTLKTDDTGTAKLEGLKPGPVSMAFALEGYLKADEAASVVAGKTTEVSITLVPEKKKVPASINGIVRSTKGGTPIAADLEIPQAKIKTKANEKGQFTFAVAGGTYTVKISAPGYITQTKDVTVKDGDQAIFNVDLHPK